MAPEFIKWPKMGRFYKDVIITEKLDGTNAQILITEDGEVFAGSRTRWVVPGDDNFGFAAWVQENKNELIRCLGPGRHYGEWFGKDIQRGYGLQKKYFALFNVTRFTDVELPEGVTTVPLLYNGPYYDGVVQQMLDYLKMTGSKIGMFPDPEGIVVFFPANQVGFKYTFNNNPKGE